MNNLTHKIKKTYDLDIIIAGHWRYQKSIFG